MVTFIWQHLSNTKYPLIGIYLKTIIQRRKIECKNAYYSVINIRKNTNKINVSNRERNKKWNYIHSEYYASITNDNFMAIIDGNDYDTK